MSSGSAFRNDLSGKSIVFCDSLHHRKVFRNNIMSGCSIDKYTSVNGGATPWSVGWKMEDHEVETPDKSRVLQVILWRVSSGDGHDLLLRVFGR